MDVFDYQSRNSQGVLIHVLRMSPVRNETPGGHVKGFKRPTEKYPDSRWATMPMSYGTW